MLWAMPIPWKPGGMGSCWAAYTVWPWGGPFSGNPCSTSVPKLRGAALAGLVAFLRERDFLLLDCQQATPHMLAMGAREIPRKEFLALLRQAVPVPDPEPVSQLPWQPWRMSFRHDAALGWLPDEQ